jgi:hypothetical protein
MISRKSLLGVLIALLGFSAVGYIVPAQLAWATTSNPDQPHMQAALSELQSARGELQAADADKGGHRVSALNLVASAISEVNAGINFDRRHDHATVFSGKAVLTLSSAATLSDQPHMKAALDHLSRAQSELQAATADKGGHRVKALRLVASAMSEVREGMAFAQR